MEQRNNGFWAFLIVVAVLGVGGAAFSYYARNAAADAHRARELELQRREKATKGLLEKMMTTHGPEGGASSLRTWFEARFRAAWAKIHPGTEPDEDLLLDAIEAFQRKIDTVPTEIAKELGGK